MGYPRGDNAPTRVWLRQHVNYSGDECLVWPFSRTKKGYGTVGITRTRTGTTAHRVMCRMAHGDPADESMIAIHSCNNGHLGCVHPKHLRWGTYVDNSADTIAAGHTGRGNRSLLTPDKVRLARSLKGQMTCVAIAKKLGVSATSIYHLFEGHTWKWLDDSTPPLNPA